MTQECTSCPGVSPFRKQLSFLYIAPCTYSSIWVSNPITSSVLAPHPNLLHTFFGMMIHLLVLPLRCMVVVDALSCIPFGGSSLSQMLSRKHRGFSTSS